MTPFKCTSPTIVLMAILSCALSPRDAQAGPLIDWLFGGFRSTPAYPVGQPMPLGNGNASGYAGYPNSVAPANYGAANYGAANSGNVAGYGSYTPNSLGYGGNYGNYYSSQLPAIGPAGAGYTAPMPSGIAAATMPSSMPPTLSYVPNFQTYSQRAPVTYYRPLLTTDPNTGAQVVAMAPCTSYEYMAQRAPTFGRTALFSTNVAPVLQAPTQAFPTYTLPSGGVPLASNSPAFASPYASGYGTRSSGYTPYSVLQPSTVSPGTYPTAPLGQSPYYGTTNGGSCGGYSAAPSTQYVPGLVAPQSPSPPSSFAPSTSPPANFAPSSSLPSNNSYPAQVYPGSGFGQPLPSNSFPAPSTNPNSILPPGQVDQGDIPPSLPTFPTTDNSNSSSRPTLRSIVRQPRSGETSTANASSNTSVDTKSNTGRELPTMMPIPVPQDFKYEPRYNPGLLREEDMTALRPIRLEQLQVAGQSKAIHWASFETAVSPPVQPHSKLRPIQVERTVTPQSSPPNQPTRKSGGWQASR